MKKQFFALAALLMVLVLVLSACFRRTDTTAASLLFYGLDDSDVFTGAINAYRETHPTVRITYKKFNDAESFENLIVNEIAEGEGPDIFYLHNTWLPRHTKKLVPLVSESLTTKAFSEVFVNVASDDFIQPDPNDNGAKKIYALPLYVDTLGLYYNKRDFEQKIPERGKPAATWDAFVNDAAKLREQAEDGKLQSGAIALGRADNIRLAVDALYNFFVQAGVPFYDKDFKGAQFASVGRESFEFMSNFAIPQNKEFSWSPDLVSPSEPLGEVEAFLAGRVSAILGYSDLYQRLENDLKNVKTRNPSTISMSMIGVAPSPQISTDEKEFKVFANYYGLAVSRNSKNSKAAWDFAQFLASRERSRAYHQDTKRPAARRDLIEEQKKEPITDIFVSQVGYAASFPIYSDRAFADIFKRAIQAAASGQSARNALSAAQTEVNDLLKREAPEGLYPPPKKK